MNFEKEFRVKSGEGHFQRCKGEEVQRRKGDKIKGGKKGRGKEEEKVREQNG